MPATPAMPAIPTHLSFAGSSSPPVVHSNLDDNNTILHHSRLNSHHPHAPRVGKIREVSAIVKMAPSTIRSKMRAGEFPASIRLSYKLAVWNLDEVEAWFQEKLNAAPVYVPYAGVPKFDVNSFAVTEVANG